MPFHTGKPKGLNTQLLQDILNRGATKRTDLIEGAFRETPKVSKRFDLRRGALGKAFEAGANKRAQNFAQQLQNVESPDFVRAQQAKARELAFRDLPTAQQNIREQLGATGGLNRGVAIQALSQPALQAAQSARDESFQIQQAARGRDIQRRQAGLDTIFRTGQGAALERLGIDKQTANVLLETGRSDILDRAFKLAGIEAGRTQGLLDIEQTRQIQDIERDKAKRARTGALIGGLGTIAGGVLGAGLIGPGLAGGGALGSLLGGSLGGQLGGFAGGGSAPDLSGILALLAARQRGGQTPSTRDLQTRAPFPGRDPRDLV